MKILTIIPTKLESTTVKEKNILLLEGKPLFHHSIDYAKASIHEVDIIINLSKMFILYQINFLQENNVKRKWLFN